MRGLSPDRPIIRGTAQNPDVYFTGRETVNKYYNAVPAIVQKTMDKFAGLTGRQYHLFDYSRRPGCRERRRHDGFRLRDRRRHHRLPRSPRARRSAWSWSACYRPFDGKAMVNALPPTVERITVLDRTKEPGAIGEPLYLDVRAAVGEAIEANGTIITADHRWRPLRPRLDRVHPGHGQGGVRQHG